MAASLNEQRTKELIKEAMLELLEERKDLFYELFSEVIEDTILVHVIRGGESTDQASRAEIFQILEDEN